MKTTLERLRAAVIRQQYDWSRLARPAQRLPPGNWRSWLLLGGRGSGKTRSASGAVRTWVKQNPGAIINIIAPTADSMRDVCIEGPAGILATCSDEERPTYEPSKRQLNWPNGCRSLLFSSQEPERLRGPQCHKLYCDELMAWADPELCWSMAMFGLRLGRSPQAVVCTTPKPSKFLKQLMTASTTIVTRMTSYENAPNLAPQFFSEIVGRYEGTRLGRQELNAELLEDNPSALWALTGIDSDRLEKAPELARVVVAVDPSGTSGEASDECGVVVAGRDGRRPQHYYVLADLSLRASPDAWARRAVVAYHAHAADRVVAEGNFGGDMVESVVHNIDPNVAFKKVTASRGKMIRAEPVAALYEQHRVHHIGVFSTLEDQMCDYVPGSSESPDRMDALVWAVSELSEGAGGDGFMRYLEMHHDKLAAEDAARGAARGGVVVAALTPPAAIATASATVIAARPATDHFGNVREPEPQVNQSPTPATKPQFSFSDPLGILRRPPKGGSWDRG
jgi:phage terminase large subunit-like protein